MNENDCANLGSEDIQAMSVDLQVDACNLACPMPLLKARQGLNKLDSQQTLRLLATDAGSVRDVKSFAELSGNALLAFSEEKQNEQVRYIYILQKA